MRSYMSIMNCRTEKDTVLICEVPEDVRHLCAAHDRAADHR